MSDFKIIADSSADLTTLEKLNFASAPLKIITADKEFMDDQNLNLKEMVDYLLSYKGKSSTSCPNPEDWLNAFGDSKNIFCVTITSNLSGSYNAAITAKDIYLEEHPDHKVFVIDSLSAGPELRLIAEKLEELILEGFSFEEICEKITEYLKSTALLFMLESMQNLANNGRVSVISAKAAGLLGIRAVGKASDVGTLQPLSKCRGEEKALNYIVEYLKNEGCTSGKVYITHCFNESAALKLEEKLLKIMPRLKTKIYSCGGLCSFYAEKGGLLVGFEKN
jgi:DegV family protein with EDD domain